MAYGHRTGQDTAPDLVVGETAVTSTSVDDTPDLSPVRGTPAVGAPAAEDDGQDAPPRRRRKRRVVVTGRLPEPHRVVPSAGGHVTVRVDGYREDVGVLARADGLGRLKVQLVRGERTVDLVDTRGERIGTLDASWLRVLTRDLVACERDGVAAVARASLVGPVGSRDLFVLLTWRGGGRPTPRT